MNNLDDKHGHTGINPGSIRILKNAPIPPPLDRGMASSASPEPQAKISVVKLAPSQLNHEGLKTPENFLDLCQPLDLDTFPNRIDLRNGHYRIPSTIPNTVHLLKSYGCSVRYDVIKKKIRYFIPGLASIPDDADNSALTYIISLASLNGLPTSQLPSYIDAIASRNPINPVADWILSKSWDGVDRLPALCATLVQREDFPQALKDILIYRWLISGVAAALLPSGFRARGVLTLQGYQSIGKTAWIRSLVPDPILRDAVVKLDHHLDAANKDSLIAAVSHWIVEIGELDSSFKKDIARLKGFTTSDHDKVRRPYARIESEYQRRTVFCATVNDQSFLVDDTGNTRWWTIPVTAINYDHHIDMQQLFAQIAVGFKNNERWWLTSEEEQWLELQNKDHRSVNVIRERVSAALDLDRRNQIDASSIPYLTPTQTLQAIGISNPTNPQCKDCTAVLREHLGDASRIKGQNKWRVPLKKEFAVSPLDDDDLY